MSAQDIVTIIGAVAVLVPIIAAGIVSVIMAFKTNQKLDQAATRREEIKDELKP